MKKKIKKKTHKRTAKSAKVTATGKVMLPGTNFSHLKNNKSKRTKANARRRNIAIKSNSKRIKNAI